MMFAQVLKILRKNKNLTQSDMANMLGITRQGYAKYENEESQPDFNTLKKIADYFDVSIDYLLGRTAFKTNDEEIFMEDISEIFEKLSTMKKKDRKTIVNTIDALYLLINRQLNKQDTSNLKAIHDIIYDLMHFDNLTKKDEFKLVNLSNTIDLIDLSRTYKESINSSMDQIIKNKFQNRSS
ncbi:helix-turn-helix domain-containing protein [Rummeliibacillus stabekisii]